MRNIYYYSFYLLATFSKKINKNNSEYAFSAMAYLSLLMSSNLFTLLSILELSQNITVKGSMFYITTMLVIMAINYYFLMSNNKSEEIINFYKERDASMQRKGSIIVFCSYVIISLVLCGYTAYLVRNVKG